tara:strand:+ start:6677 stop:7285 length:609 start_codon:yes stop_codon:yes gene_type:complete
MNNYQRYKCELDERYKHRIKKNTATQDEFVIKKPKPTKSLSNQYKQQIIVLDSEDRDKTKNPSINDFVLNLAESLKNVLVLRLIRSEYTIEEYYASMIINQNRVPIQFFKSFTTYVYLNGYKKIQIANGTNNEIFSQVSAGIEVLPPISANFFYDPYSIVMNPIEKKIKRFDIKLLDGKGTKIDIPNDSTGRLILTLAVFTL